MATNAALLLCLSTVLITKGSKAQECGDAPLNTKIVGGENATDGSWPWQVSLHYLPNNMHVCGGTLIHQQWVLTAAHCLTEPGTSASDWALHFGKLTQSATSIHEVTRPVSQVIIHPDYNNNTFDMDIGLLKLSSPVTFTDYIRPICLASNSSQFLSSTMCWATGWGKINSDEQLPASAPLQQVQIPVVGKKECSCIYGAIEAANITDTMICAGELNKGICQGDSGGPLQCKLNSIWIQAGISSFGIPCSIGVPEVFARVSQFELWIKEQMAADGASASFRTVTPSGTDPDSSFDCDAHFGTTPADSTVPPTTSRASSVTTKLTFVVVLVTLLQPL
ncbi:chymotrypsin-like protease CTRL-1 [Cynoglossus semilaevis]|uniref:chymotrypsin-like protease CTRL-1 n=1 Tax=Cynoglossus semilaevis TaxID=244447 RepID=UPI000D625DCB|nr:chymotrypsin-like protease CTRL-1 [Cynoglossus semilaevis]